MILCFDIQPLVPRAASRPGYRYQVGEEEYNFTWVAYCTECLPTTS